MRALTGQQQIATEFEKAGETVKEALAGLSEQQASAAAPDGWSAKDHLNHLTVWHEMRFFEMSRIARGGAFGFPPTEEEGIQHLNEQFVANRRPLTLAQCLSDYDFARAMVLEALASCPEERLDQRFCGELSFQGGAAHDREHAEMIRSLRRLE